MSPESPTVAGSSKTSSVTSSQDRVSTESKNVFVQVSETVVSESQSSWDIAEAQHYGSGTVSAKMQVSVKVDGWEPDGGEPQRAEDMGTVSPEAGSPLFEGRGSEYANQHSHPRKVTGTTLRPAISQAIWRLGDGGRGASIASEIRWCDTGSQTTVFRRWEVLLPPGVPLLAWACH